MPTPEEQKDLDALKAKNNQFKIEAFDLAAEYIRMDADTLKHSGHSSKEFAVLSCIKYAQADIKRATDAFLKKWPD